MAPVSHITLPALPETATDFGRSARGRFYAQCHQRFLAFYDSWPGHYRLGSYFGGVTVAAGISLGRPYLLPHSASCRFLHHSLFALDVRTPSASTTPDRLTNRWSQPLSVVMTTLDFMKQSSMFATPAVASGGSAPSR